MHGINHKLTQGQLDNKLITACVKGSLQEVRYWLTSAEVKVLHGSHATISTSFPLGCACEHGYLDIVEYLLTSQEIIQAGGWLANLHADNDSALKEACASGQLHVVEYLLAFTQDKQNGYGPQIIVDAFTSACSWEQWNIINFFIFDYAMEESPSMQSIIQRYPHLQLHHVFERKRLKDALDHALAVKDKAGKGKI